jgi:hypothetical protein
MKKMLISILAIIAISVFYCSNDSSTNIIKPSPLDKIFFAIVNDTSNIDCHIPLIKFVGDTTGIYMIFQDTTYNKQNYNENSKFGLEFLALNFPDSLNNMGQMIKIKFRKPTNGEIPNCTDLGPSYLSVFMLSVKKIDNKID